MDALEVIHGSNIQKHYRFCYTGVIQNEKEALGIGVEYRFHEKRDIYDKFRGGGNDRWSEENYMERNSLRTVRYFYGDFA